MIQNWLSIKFGTRVVLLSCVGLRHAHWWTGYYSLAKGIPSYIRGITIPGYFSGFSPINISRSSRIVWQIVCTDTCMVSMAFQGHYYSHQAYYFVHNVLLYCNKYLFIPILHGNLKFHNYFIHTIPNMAGSGSFTESHPILRKDKFTINIINLWQFWSIYSTLTRFISRPTIIISFYLSSLVVSKITTFEVIPKRSLSKKLTEKVLPTENLDHW